MFREKFFPLYNLGLLWLSHMQMLIMHIQGIAIILHLLIISVAIIHLLIIGEVSSGRDEEHDFTGDSGFSSSSRYYDDHDAYCVVDLWRRPPGAGSKGILHAVKYFGLF